MADFHSSPEELARALSETNVAHVIELTLTEITRPSELCDTLLHRCFVHGNGFEAYQLLAPDFGIDGDLVVHIWPSQTATTESVLTSSDVHDHRWDLASRVISGRLEMRLNEITDDTSHLHYVHRRDAGWGHSFAMLRRSGIRPIDKITVEAGDTYALAHPLLHEVRVKLDTPTVTVMLRGPEQRLTTNVLTRHPKTTTNVVRPPRLPADYVRRRLELVAKALDRANVNSTAICR
jgi:hypothetical protein